MSFGRELLDETILSIVLLRIDKFFIKKCSFLSLKSKGTIPLKVKIFMECTLDDYKVFLKCHEMGTMTVSCLHII